MPYRAGRLIIWFDKRQRDVSPKIIYVAMISSKQISKKYQLRPRKRLGQCFLQDANIVRKIVGHAGLRSDDTVVEIGAGLGAMTGLIAAVARQVLALEIDQHLVDALRGELRDLDNVRIIHTDVLTFDLSQAANDLSVKKLKIMGNIPYNISTPILFHLLQYRSFISSAILMVQKEVAERISAHPGTKSYGIPSVFTSVYARTSLEFTVPASCFYPVPKVTSAVLKVDFLEEPIAFIEDEALFREVVRLAFSNRRKTLLNNLRRHIGFDCSEEALHKLFQEEELDIRIRGEALAPEQFISFSNRLCRVIHEKGSMS